MKLKRAIQTTLSICILVLAWGSVSKAADVTSDNDRIKPNEDGSYSVTFTLEEDEAFAGSEFCISCSEGVSVKDVSYDKMVSSVAPKQARGYTWFGFYGASNEYNEPITVTATVEVEKEDEKEIPNIAEEIDESGENIDQATVEGSDEEQEAEVIPHLLLASVKTYRIEDGQYLTDEMLLDKVFYLVGPDETGDIFAPIEEIVEKSTATKVWGRIAGVIGGIVAITAVAIIYKNKKRRKTRKRGEL